MANAIGSAISKVSGTYEQLIDYDKVPRDEALAKARAEAVELAVAAAPFVVRWKSLMPKMFRCNTILETPPE